MHSIIIQNIFNTKLKNLKCQLFFLLSLFASATINVNRTFTVIMINRKNKFHNLKCFPISLVFNNNVTIKILDCQFLLKAIQNTVCFRVGFIYKDIVANIVFTYILPIIYEKKLTTVLIEKIDRCTNLNTPIATH